MYYGTLGIGDAAATAEQQAWDQCSVEQSNRAVAQKELDRWKALEAQWIAYEKAKAIHEQKLAAMKRAKNDAAKVVVRNDDLARQVRDHNQDALKKHPRSGLETHWCVSAADRTSAVPGCSRAEKIAQRKSRTSVLARLSAASKPAAPAPEPTPTSTKRTTRRPTGLKLNGLGAAVVTADPLWGGIMRYDRTELAAMLKHSVDPDCVIQDMAVCPSFAPDPSTDVIPTVPAAPKPPSTKLFERPVVPAARDCGPRPEAPARTAETPKPIKTAPTFVQQAPATPDEPQPVLTATPTRPQPVPEAPAPVPEPEFVVDDEDQEEDAGFNYALLGAVALVVLVGGGCAYYLHRSAA